MSRGYLLALIATFAIALSGCYSGVLLKPIQGPAPKVDPLMDPRGTFKAGRFYVDLDNITKPIFHEECIGQWEPATSPKPSTANASDADDLSAVWDVVYGVGYYEKTVQKAKLCARGSGKSKKGTVLQAEMCQFEERAGGKLKIVKKGVAKDNRNNIYQIQ